LAATVSAEEIHSGTTLQEKMDEIKEEKVPESLLIDRNGCDR
jgi:hypothetical protein